jgi:hypothetical protein
MIQAPPPPSFYITLFNRSSDSSEICGLKFIFLLLSCLLLRLLFYQCTLLKRISSMNIEGLWDLNLITVVSKDSN